MNDLAVLNRSTIDSREVAEMIGKGHKELLRDIRRYCEQLGESKIALTDFFTESFYKTSQNKEMPCYNVTKKGCEFIAHKLTGVKGAEFTAKYINRFHEMEDVIRGNAMPQGKELLALAVLEAQKTIEQQSAQIEEMKPKAIFADAVASSHTSILIGDLAKLLKQNGVETGQRRLFAKLREEGYLIKSGSSKNMPTQRAMEMKLFEVKEGSYVDANGCNITTKTTKVTGKGQQYFINKFLGVSADDKDENAG